LTTTTIMAKQKPIFETVEPFYQPMRIIMIALDLLLSLASFSWMNALLKLVKKDPVRSVPAGRRSGGGDDDEEDPSHRVLEENKRHLARIPSCGGRTVHECFDRTATRFGSNVAVRYRAFRGGVVAKSEGKMMMREYDPVITELTYAQVADRAYRFGAALAAVGCVPSDPVGTIEKVTKPCRIVMIFDEKTRRPEWMIAALGAFSQSLGIVAVDSSCCGKGGIDSVAEAIADNAAAVVVCDRANAKRLVAAAAAVTAKAPCLTTIVCTSDDDLPAAAAPEKLTVVSFEDFLESGDTAKHPVLPPVPDSTAAVVYTSSSGRSNSAGPSRGVVIRHAALVASFASSELRINPDWSCRYLGYRPLSDVTELALQLSVLACGGSIGYADDDPESLIDAPYPVGALRAFRPTHLVAVPRIWDAIRKHVTAEVARMSPGKRALVNIALEWREIADDWGLDTPLFDLLVFRRFRNLLGGDVRLAVSAGGPLDPNLHAYLRTAFGGVVPLIQAYDLAETCGPVAAQALDDPRGGVAGCIYPSVEIKLASTTKVRDGAGLPYLVGDRHDVDGNPVWGRGTVLVRGWSVATGYYDDPEKTDEVFLDDGWIATGDVGMFLEDGSLAIVVDRETTTNPVGSKKTEQERHR